jgi:VWFA-related protein
VIRALVLVPLSIALGAAPQFRTSVDVVRVEALVLDDGKPVAGLAAADFALTDNGVPQTIAVRALGSQPIDVVVALDVSSSVQGSRLEQLRTGARALVAQLGTADRASLVTFDHRLTLGPRDAAAASLDARLAAIRAGGRTSLTDAVTTALIWTAGRGRPCLVLVFSDGRDVSSWTRLDQALEVARTSDAVVDAVLTGELLPTSISRLEAGNFASAATPDERFLVDLATETGGRVHNGESGAGLAGAFRTALEHFRARYEITYTPTSGASGWHAVELRVPGRKGVSIHARRGYLR